MTYDVASNYHPRSDAAPGEGPLLPAAVVLVTETAENETADERGLLYVVTCLKKLFNISESLLNYLVPFSLWI